LEIQRQRVSWEQSRMIAFYSIAPHSKSIRKPTDLFTFDWDESPKTMSKERFEKENEHLKESWKKLME
jgi:hypothetical protein